MPRYLVCPQRGVNEQGPQERAADADRHNILDVLPCRALPLAVAHLHTSQCVNTLASQKLMQSLMCVLSSDVLIRSGMMSELT